MMRACDRCGEPFESDRSHHRYCWPCYWELRERGRFHDQQPPPSRTAAPAALDPRLLRDAIALCHPDRHPPERAKTANAVTAALLELLQQSRRAA